MKYVYLYGTFAVIIGALYFVKGKKMSLSEWVQQFRGGSSVHSTPPSGSSETTELLEEMYKEFMYALEDLRLKYAEQSEEMEVLREKIDQLSAGTDPSVTETTFTAKQIAQIVGVSESTIRKWEKEFSEYIPSPQGEAGAKRYSETGLSVLFQIKFMRDKRMSVIDIKMELSKTVESVNSTSEQAEESGYHDSIRGYLADGLPPEDIAKRLGVSVTEIKILQNKWENAEFVM